MTRSSATAVAPLRPKGAVHSAEIEYAMGDLKTNKVYAWEPADYENSKTMQEYFANFIKTGNPNGKGLLKWPAAVMHIDVQPRVETESARGRHQTLDRVLP